MDHLLACKKARHSESVTDMDHLRIAKHRESHKELARMKWMLSNAFLVLLLLTPL